MSKLNLREINFLGNSFPENRYFKIAKPKKQIVLHHTVSGRGACGDINWWLQDPARIATAFIIDWEGKIHQLFSSRFWAHHLGVPVDTFREHNIPLQYRQNGARSIVANNAILNEESIGIELDAWGGLVRCDQDLKWYPGKFDVTQGKFVPRKNLRPLSEDRIEYYPSGYRGFFAYEKYTEPQLESMRQLIEFLCDTYDIPKTYNSDMWYISPDALKGKPGIWSHTSYREDKSDAHPQYELKQVLENLQ